MVRMLSRLRGAAGAALRGAADLLGGARGSREGMVPGRGAESRAAGYRGAVSRAVVVAGALVFGVVLGAGFTACAPGNSGSVTVRNESEEEYTVEMWNIYAKEISGVPATLPAGNSRTWVVEFNTGVDRGVYKINNNPGLMSLGSGDHHTWVWNGSALTKR